jgi:CubicO group peptidase (beta-lactamase class C family)
VTACPFPTARPEEFDLDSTVLNSELSHLLEKTNSYAAALVVRGKLVWESYWKGATPASRFDTCSIAKAYAAVAIGVLQDDGKLNVDDPACKFLAEWAGDERKEITIRHLLTTTSGLHLDLDRFMSDADPTAAVLRWPLEYKPGTVWSYEQATSHALCPIIKRLTGKQPIDFLQERVLGPIGATETGWCRAPSGDCTCHRGILTSARELACFGQLLLNKGTFNGRRFLSERFVEQATRHDPLIERCKIEKTQEDNRRRNWGWNMFTNDGGWWEGVAKNCFCPRGAFDNLCLCDPNYQFVFTRLSFPQCYDKTKMRADLDTGLAWRTVLSAFKHRR